MTFELPPAIHYYTNKIWYLVLWLPYIALYELINRFPIAQPRVLSFSALDAAVSFVPGFLLIYIANTLSQYNGSLRAVQGLAATVDDRALSEKLTEVIERLKAKTFER